MVKKVVFAHPRDHDLSRGHTLRSTLCLAWQQTLIFPRDRAACGLGEHERVSTTDISVKFATRPTGQA